MRAKKKEGGNEKLKGVEVEVYYNWLYTGKKNQTNFDHRSRGTPEEG